MLKLHRRSLLATAAFVVLGNGLARADIIHGSIPWKPASASPPSPVQPGPWHFFTASEGRTIEAIVDRLIPPDPETPGGKDAGCAVFIDRQLAGPYGRSEGLYVSGPFRTGTKQQGEQSPLTPSVQYRQALAALDAHCQASFGGRAFADLADADKDQIIGALESGELHLGATQGKSFFTILLKNTHEGFFSDPIYGGNRDMVAWKMIGFPGARYDYSDWIDRHNEPYPHPPIGITGAPAWSVR